ncbi:MAG: beta-phosphoglucomutase [Flavobacteriales bacterium]|nr:beta-phosphoglucomutase [Flavobacteriales bacterium]
MIKGCIFDMDGVIVDSAKYHFVAWQRLATELSVPFTEEDNEQLKGLSRVDSLERILAMGNLVLDNDTKMSLMDKKNQWYLDLISDMDASEILPGVADFINEIKTEGIKVGLGSSSKNAKRILETIGLKAQFDEIVDGTDVTFSKPDPEVFEIGASRMGLNPDEIVVFEDATSGVRAAIVGGFKCVGIGEPEVLHEAHRVIPGFQDFNFTDLKKTFETK